MRRLLLAGGGGGGPIWCFGRLLEWFSLSEDSDTPGEGDSDAIGRGRCDGLLTELEAAVVSASLSTASSRSRAILNNDLRNRGDPPSTRSCM